MTIRSETQLVLVDVVVLGPDGRPIHGLSRDSFHLLEDGVEQTLKRFEEHTVAEANAPAGPALQLPEGTFSNYTPLPPGSSLNVLLLDSLNTANTDQAYVQTQLREYLKHAAPGTRIAIFGLSDHVYLLQGFTSDPEILKAVVNGKHTRSTSPLLPSTSTGETSTTLSTLLNDKPPPPRGEPATSDQIGDNLKHFEDGLANIQAQMRVQDTINAFNELGHYLASFPGRKNLIWFSGSFPLNILPDPVSQGGEHQNLSGAQSNQNNNDVFRDTINLLSRAQVAVYPIDARGLEVNSVYSAQTSGQQFRNPSSISATLAQKSQQQAAERSTMDQLANATGGQAYYNTNGLAQAVVSAVDDGSTFYTLAYSPAKHDSHGEFRRIRVLLQSSSAPLQPKLSYRQGYYADNLNQPHTGSAHDAAETTAYVSASSASSTPPASPAAIYEREAMTLGAPAPQDVLFKVSVLPESSETEELLAPGNKANPAMKVNGPFRRFAVKLGVPPSQIHLLLQPDGRHTGTIQVLVFVYDKEGRVLNRVGKTIELSLQPETYKHFIEGPMDFRLDVSVPAGGQTFLRIGVHDLPSNRMGVVEVPAVAVNGLQPSTAYE